MRLLAAVTIAFAVALLGCPPSGKGGQATGLGAQPDGGGTGGAAGRR